MKASPHMVVEYESGVEVPFHVGLGDRLESRVDGLLGLFLVAQ